MSIIILNIKRVPRRMRSWEKGYHNKTRVFVFPQGVGVIEALFARGTEPHREYRKLLATSPLVPEFDGAKWSRHAGCAMCPCSPGFILPDCLLDQDIKPYDIFIDVCDIHAPAAMEGIAGFARALGELVGPEASYLDLVAA